MSGLPIVTAATALAFPPTAEYGLVPASWGSWLVEEFDLEVWAAASTNLTVAELLGGTLEDKTIAATEANSVTHGSDIFTETGHGLLTGDGPIRLTTSGTLPTGLALATDYWIIKATDDTFKLAHSLSNALAGTAINFTSDGTGAHTYTGTALCKRLHWTTLGLLGNAGDGAITLTAQRAYRVRCRHTPRIVAYSMTATFSAAEAVSATVYPVPLR
jgi:hypothetical protein